MNSIYLGNGLGMNNILKEEACTQIITIKGNIFKIIIPPTFETSYFSGGFREEIKR